MKLKGCMRESVRLCRVAGEFIWSSQQKWECQAVTCILISKSYKASLTSFTLFDWTFVEL